MQNQGQLYFGLFLTSDTLLMAIYLLSGFLALAVIVSMMRIYKKCGKPAISVIIPIWGQIVLFQITGIAWWYVFIPVVNLIMMIKAYIVLAKKFGRSAGFAVGMIFLPMIFIPLLSFYDYAGDEKNEETEEPIYNPFNETNVEPVNVLEPVAPIQAVDSNEVNGTDIESTDQIEESVTMIPDVPVNSNEDVQLNEQLINEEELMVENVIPTEEIIPEVTNVQAEEIIAEPLVEEVNAIANPTVQDIEDALNINKEPVDVAFNSTPIIEPVQEEILEPVQNTLETEEVIELPEIAAKVCPACGVSLAENVNFCTSCGTKL